MARKADQPRKIIEAALGLAAEQGWANISLGDIAAASKLPLSSVYPLFPSKRSVLEGFSRMIDATVIAEQEAEEESGSARDRLFDVMMRRFDALQPYKEAVGRVLYDQLRDPFATLCSTRQLRRSMALMLEAAKISSSGVRGVVRTKGLVAIYLATLRVWLRDESADMSKTMACLDGYLRRIETCATRFACKSRRREADNEA